MNAMKYVGKRILLRGQIVKVVSVMPRHDGWARVRVFRDAQPPLLENLTEAALDKARLDYLNFLSSPYPNYN